MMYDEEKLKALRASLLDERQAEYGTAELVIEAAIELCDLALQAKTWQKIADQRAIEVADLKHELAKVRAK
jgi:hypothetical protein